jgi:hypothetical protein
MGRFVREAIESFLARTPDEQPEPRPVDFDALDPCTRRVRETPRGLCALDDMTGTLFVTHDEAQNIQRHGFIATGGFVAARRDIVEDLEAVR